MQTGMWGIIKKIKMCKSSPKNDTSGRREICWPRLLLRRLVLQKFKRDVRV